MRIIYSANAKFQMNCAFFAPLISTESACPLPHPQAQRAGGSRTAPTLPGLGRDFVSAKRVCFLVGKGSQNPSDNRRGRINAPRPPDRAARRQRGIAPLRGDGAHSCAPYTQTHHRIIRGRGVFAGATVCPISPDRHSRRHKGAAGIKRLFTLAMATSRPRCYCRIQKTLDSRVRRRARE